MSGFTTVALGGLLGALFLSLVAILLWQEAKRRRKGEELVYVVSDALRHIKNHLPSEVRKRVSDAGIQRIIEWEVYYLQGLAQDNRRDPVETVAGGSQSSVGYISQQIAKRHGMEITSDDIRAVLELEAEYLLGIGAVGQKVGPLAEFAEEEKG
ncbi:MAG: hypothetical protein OXC98_03765 [bacterium]|nr:hypothetical protein [Acidimicrobiia bacterium]MCY4649467.1 hypothetical protein [bacterium]